jgi:tetratricopeptide (TPR) repeat protein
MKLRDLIPGEDQMKMVQGIESNLLQRRRMSTIGGLIGLGAALLQFTIALLEEDYFKDLTTFLGNVLTGKWSELSGTLTGITFAEVIGISVLVAGFGTYIVLRRTKFFMKESEEPFRYTFWIKPFTAVEDTPGNRFTLREDDRLVLLHYDLMEKLNYRIKRLSLLDADSLPEDKQEMLSSHIHIEGEYTIREEKKNSWVLHVMPRIRIGPPGKPQTLVYAVKYPLVITHQEDINGDEPDSDADSKTGVDFSLDADRYNQIVERVYSRIATEIYRQILTNVREKIEMFPTKYLRAVALYHEARDFERSNTIDAYDHALQLYSEAKRYFDIRFTGRVNDLLLKIPVFWRLTADSYQREARTRIGYCRCLIYRRVISELSGRNQNMLFEIPEEIERAIFYLTAIYNWISRQWKLNLSLKKETQYDQSDEASRRDQLNSLFAYLTFPNDSPLKRNRRRFDTVRISLSDAYTVSALAWAYLDAMERAKTALANARSIAPVVSSRNALWFLAAAEIEPDIDQKILFLRQAAELSPEFEIAQYKLATFSEMKLRMQDEIAGQRIGSVINAYEEVLRINPGNIGALTAQGYLYWLVGDPDNSKKKLEEGCEIKALVRQTFIGNLTYGLARIAAEEGEFQKSYEFYQQAIASDPGVGAYFKTSGNRGPNAYYDYIVPGILRRYEAFRKGVDARITSSLSGEGTKSSRTDENVRVAGKTLDIVLSFVLNDVGNAYLNYYHRFGDPNKLSKAISCFEKATTLYKDNVVAYYNLHNAYDFNRSTDADIAKCLEQAEKLAPAWPEVLIASAHSQIKQVQSQIADDRKKLREKMERLERVRQQRESIIPGRIAGQSAQAENIVIPQQNVFSVGTKTDEDNIPELLKDIENIKLSIETNERRLEGPVFENVTQKIMGRTKLSSLFKGLSPTFKGDGVEEFLGKRIEHERLDETDVDAIFVWAEIISNNQDNPKALLSAEKLCRFVLQYYPEDFNVHKTLRNVYRYLKVSMTEPDTMYSDSHSKCEKALQRIVDSWMRIDPVHYVSLLWVKDVFVHEKCIGYYEKAYESKFLAGVDKKAYSRELADLYNTTGNQYFDKNDYILAGTYYERAISLDRSQSVYYANLGLTRYNIHMYTEAISAYKKALTIDPTNGSHLNGLGNVYYITGQFKEAAESYQKAIDAKPDVAVYRSNLGLALSYQDKFAEAVDAYNSALLYDSENADTYNDLGVVLYKTGEYEKAIRQYIHAVEKDPDQAVYHSNLALAYRDSEQFDKAVSSYTRAIELNPKNANYYNDLAIVYYNNGKYVEAISNYKRAIELNPTLPVFYANTGLAYRDAEQFKEAIRWYEKAIELDPSGAEWYNGLGVVYYRLRDYDSALRCYNKAVELSPDISVYYGNIALAYRDQGKYTEAIPFYEKAAEFDPSTAETYNALGVIHYRLGAFDKALDYYEKAVGLKPEEPTYYTNSGLVYYDLNELDAAIKHFGKAVELDPDNPEFHNFLGNAYIRSGAFESAHSCYLKATELSPGTSVYRSNLGLTWEQLGEREKSEEAFLKAVELDGTNADAYNALGNLYFRVNNYEAAEPYYRKAVELSPRHDIYRNNLALSLMHMMKYTEAVEEYEKAIAINPNNAQHYNGLGHVYFSLGELSKAVKYLTEAVVLSPEESLYRFDLQAALGNIPDKGTVDTALNELLGKYPGNEALLEIMNTSNETAG